jgi:DNA-binding NtrC family response regulator
MADTILVSTHRIDVAGRLREALEDRGFRVDLVPEVEQLDLAPDPILAILTGGDEEWVRAIRDRMGLPFFTTLPGPDGVARGRTLGAEWAFGAHPDPEEVAGSVHRAMERVRLREATGIVGATEIMQEVLERIVQVAPFPSTVLVTGESGTGKELVARGIHYLSPRRPRSFLAVNVAALTDSLLESELFGHEKGAFTGAIDSRRGFFELAHQGSLFLDEIGEMPLSTQTKLLRVLERGEFLRVGGEKPREADVRIIAATNRDLRAQVASGDFRRDLYYRLNVLSIELPPLRRRRDDVPLLIDHFVRELSQRMDRPFPGITDRAMAVLKAYDWPGNVRELRNLVESMVVLSPGREIEPADIPREIRFPREGPRLLPPPRSHSTTAEQVRREVERDRAEADDEGDVGVGRRAGLVALSGEEAQEREGAARIRPELELVFRTLLELRMDMDQLRREFEAYREEVDDRLLDAEPPTWALPGGSGVEVGVSSAGPEGSSGGDSQDPEANEPAPHGPGDQDSEGSVGVSGKEAEDDDGPLVFRPGMTMDELEAEAIRLMLEHTDGNRRKAAEQLGIGERTLYRKLKRYGIDG